MDDSSTGRHRVAVLALAPLAGLVVALLPLGGIDPWAQHVLAVVAVALVLWMGEGLPIAVTALLVVVLLALIGPGSGEDAARQALYGFQLPAGYFLIGTLVVGAAAVESGLATRLAGTLVASAHGSAGRIYRQLLLLIPPSAILIPSATTRNAILIPAYEDVFRRIGFGRGERLPRVVSLALATLQVLGSTAVLTGGVVPITAAFLLGGFSWLRWFVVMALPCYAILAFSGALLFVRQRPRAPQPAVQAPAHPASEAATGAATAAGTRWSPAEKRAAAIIAAMLALWLTDRWTGWDPMIPALLGAVALLAPGIGVLTWNAFERSSPWPIFLVTCSALSMAHALQASGAAGWLTSSVLALIPLARLPLALVVPLLLLLVVPINLVLPNRAGVLAIVIPLLTSIAREIGLNPVPLGLMATIVTQSTIFYPVQNAAALLAYQPGHFTPGDLLRAGLTVFGTALVILPIVAVPWWSLLGLPLRVTP